MNRLILATLCGIFLSACAQLDDLTGTSVQERCLYRQVLISQLEAVEDRTPAQEDALVAYRAYVTTVCASVPGEPA